MRLWGVGMGQRVGTRGFGSIIYPLHIHWGTHAKPNSGNLVWGQTAVIIPAKGVLWSPLIRL